MQAQDFSRCAECRAPISLAGEDRRRHREAGTRPRCSVCRRRYRIVVTDELKAYWLDRYSLAELRELAESIWPS